VILNPPIDTESRLSRAAELAEYLLQNPKETRGDAEELGSRFGLSVALVAQIQSSVHARSSAPPSTRKSIADRLEAFWKGLLKLAARCVSQPFIFQIAAAVVTALEGFSRQGSDGIAVALWCGLQAWCLLLRPRFRYAAFGSLLIWGVAGALFSDALHTEKLSAAVPPGLFEFLFGMSMAVLNLMLGGILVVVGGSIQIAAQRRRHASLSRQDLVVRMFELQQQLAALPVQAPKILHPWIAFARQRPFLTAAVLMLVTSSLEHASALLFHVDVFAIQQAQAVQQANAAQHAQATKVNVVLVSPRVGSGSFLMVVLLLNVVSTTIRIGLGFLANSWRKVWWMGAGMLVAFTLSTAWAAPAGALGSMPKAMVATLPVQEAISSLLMVLIVRFAVGFNRALTIYRTGAAPDEARVVGELLEIRHRLSANPATICVLVVDAAGSTQMKKSEDQLRVEYSFGRYQNWIGQIVAEHGGKVEIRTGDGAICAFGGAEAALAAARKLQTEVNRFNETENKLELPFRLRVALHAGLVQADLDKVQFTEVIDVAAHTEKYSPIGGIALTEAFVRALATHVVTPVCATVDGFEVYAMTVEMPGMENVEGATP